MPLTPAEQAAIAAYSGPVTICEPRTCTEDKDIRYKHHNRRLQFSNAHERARQKGQSTKNMIRDLHAQDYTPEQIAKRSGMTLPNVLQYMREMGL